MSKFLQVALRTTIFVLVAYAATFIISDNLNNLSDTNSDKIGIWLEIARWSISALLFLFLLIGSIADKQLAITINVWLILGVVSLLATTNSYINDQISRGAAITDIIFTTILFLIVVGWNSNNTPQESK